MIPTEVPYAGQTPRTRVELPSSPRGVCDMANQKRYDKNFKLGAARVVVEQRCTQAEAARRLGVSA